MAEHPKSEDSPSQNGRSCDMDTETKASQSGGEKADQAGGLDEVLVKPTSQANLRNPRFWAILIALCFSGLLTSLEATITSTALPSIVADLGGGDLYIWAANGYFLAMLVNQSQPHILSCE